MPVKSAFSMSKASVIPIAMSASLSSASYSLLKPGIAVSTVVFSAFSSAEASISPVSEAARPSSPASPSGSSAAKA